MSHENVVPFEGRRAMSRRGSPDKAFSFDSIELDCPDCGALLLLEAEPMRRREASCERCGTVVDLALESRTAGARPGE